MSQILTRGKRPSSNPLNEVPTASPSSEAQHSAGARREEAVGRRPEALVEGQPEAQRGAQTGAKRPQNQPMADHWPGLCQDEPHAAQVEAQEHAEDRAQSGHQALADFGLKPGKCFQVCESLVPNSWICKLPSWHGKKAVSRSGAKEEMLDMRPKLYL